MSTLAGVIAHLYKSAETRNGKAIENERTIAMKREQELREELSKHEKAIQLCEEDRQRMQGEILDLSVRFARLEGRLGVEDGNSSEGQSSDTGN